MTAEQITRGDPLERSWKSPRAPLPEKPTPIAGKSVWRPREALLSPCPLETAQPQTEPFLLTVLQDQLHLLLLRMLPGKPCPSPRPP